jgi:hypothetical protein
MYWNQAIRQHDAAELIQVAVDDVTKHQNNGHWIVIPRAQVPYNQPVLDAAWSMKRKSRLLPKKVYKLKARLNLHGGQQKHRVDYW